MNYFELFELPEQIIIEPSFLQKRYYELSKKFHPDFFTQSNEIEQNDALEKSSMINKAFQTFKSIDKTIEYELQINNLLQEDEKQTLSAEFLMEMMEVNESLSDATLENNQDKIHTIKLEINTLQKNLWNNINTIAQEFNSNQKHLKI